MLLVLVGGLAGADEPPKPPAAPAAPAPETNPAPPPTPEQAADAVRAAVKAKDEAALKALAAKDDPDPWLVADELIRRGEFDTADAFAKAAPRVDVEKLPAYVASRRGKPDDPARRARLATANAALQAGKSTYALEALGAQEPAAIDDVVGVRMAVGRGLALRSLARLDVSAAAFLTAGEAAAHLGWLRDAYLASDSAGVAAYYDAAMVAARAAWTRALSISEQRGDRVGAARMLGNLGNAHFALENYPEARATYERALAAMEALGDKAGALQTLGNIGEVQRALGDRAEALATHERVLAAQVALGDGAGVATTLGAIADDHDALGDYTMALAVYERALAALETQGGELEVASVRGRMGAVYAALGDYAAALSMLERALAAKESLGDKAGAATTLSNIGEVYEFQGNYAKALATYERALTSMEGIGDRSGAATTLGNIGSIYNQLGAHAKALAIHERVLASMESLGDRVGVATALGVLGTDHFALGNDAQALEMMQRALAIKEALGERAQAAQTLGNIAVIHWSRGNFAQALATEERALEACQALGNRAGAALALRILGLVCLSSGDLGRATEFLDRAVGAAEDLRSDELAASALTGRAQARLRSGDAARALEDARRAVPLLSAVVGGLGDEQGATAMEAHTRLFEVGVEAATTTGDTPAAVYFLESGRAGSLLEAFGARGSLRSGLVPTALAAEEAHARAKEALASRAYRRALDVGGLDAMRTRRRELDESQAAVQAVVERIQREAKAAANVVHFRPDGLDTIRARLAPGDVLVTYGLFDEGPLALVVTPGGATTVRLPATKDIGVACDALLAAIDERQGADATNLAADTLRDLVVKPLGLPPETKRLLIAPDGVLSYVPFALLVADRNVAYVPSGTTYGLLLEDGKARGAGVLALGDPDYQTEVDGRAASVYRRGAFGRLARLPATAAEARAIGDAVLLGTDATEKRLLDAVSTKPRWRAVHFACHGLIDSERPAFSSLALTADGVDDGFLTALEVFRAKLPADLVVLSACETAKGKVVKGEGIVGLTRAFMFAGSPRVISSLWKVDDDATRALMTKFYELWSPKDGTPGLPTAEALKQAQAFVKAQEKWKHPYFWAAWVLWGLPE